MRVGHVLGVPTDARYGTLGYDCRPRTYLRRVAILGVPGALGVGVRSAPSPPRTKCICYIYSSISTAHVPGAPLPTRVRHAPPRRRAGDLVRAVRGRGRGSARAKAGPNPAPCTLHPNPNSHPYPYPKPKPKPKLSLSLSLSLTRRGGDPLEAEALRLMEAEVCADAPSTRGATNPSPSPNPKPSPSRNPAQVRHDQGRLQPLRPRGGRRGGPPQARHPNPNPYPDPDPSPPQARHPNPNPNPDPTLTLTLTRTLTLH